MSFPQTFIWNIPDQATTIRKNRILCILNCRIKGNPKEKIISINTVKTQIIVSLLNSYSFVNFNKDSSEVKTNFDINNYFMRN